MKRLALILTLAAGPALAQSGPAPGPTPSPVPAPAPGDSQGDSQGDMGKGFDLMQEGTKLMLRGLVAQMEPGMRKMMATLVTLMGDINAYDAPVVLPNGDILIRRKVPKGPAPPRLPDPPVEGRGQTEL